jgi:hypothetical protein
MTTPEADRLSQIKARLEKAVADEAATEEPDRCANFDKLRDALSLVEQLQQERDGRMAEVEHWVTRYNELDAWRVEVAKQRNEAEATSARLRTALEQLIEDWRNAASVCSIYNHVEGDAEDVFNKCAAELTAALGEPDGRRVPQLEKAEE